MYPVSSLPTAGPVSWEPSQVSDQLKELRIQLSSIEFMHSSISWTRVGIFLAHRLQAAQELSQRQATQFFTPFASNFPSAMVRGMGGEQTARIACCLQTFCAYL